MKKDEALRGFGWNTFFTILNRVILPLVGVVMASLIGADGFGNYAALNSTYVIIELFREAGLGITFVADKEISAAREKTYNFISVANGLVFAGLLFLGRHQIADRFQDQTLVSALTILAVGMIFACVGTIPLLKLTRAARFRDTGLIDLVTNFSSYIVAVIALASGAGFMALVFQMFSRNVMFCILTNVVSRSAWGKPNMRDAKEIMGKAVANMGSNIAYTVYTMGDYILVRTLLGPAATGLYTFAYNIAVKPVEIVTGPLRQTIFVALSRTQHDPDRLKQMFGRALSTAVFLTIPVYALLLFLAEPIIHIFPGHAFDPAVPFLQLLCGYLFMRSLGTMASVALVASGKERWTVYGWIPGYAVAITYIAAHWPAIAHLPFASYARQGISTGGVGQVPFTAVTAGATPQILAGLSQVVIGLSLGASACYAVYLIVAFRFLRPPSDVIARIWLAVRIGAVTAAVLYGITWLPIHEYGRLALASFVSVVLQLALISKALLGSARAAFSRSGVKRIYEAL